MPLIRLRMHLSTAVVLMFVAGCLIWANVQNRTAYGWPKVAYDLPDDFFDPPNFRRKVLEYETNFYMALLDVAVAMLILSSVWFVCEWLIARRAVK